MNYLKNKSKTKSSLTWYVFIEGEILLYSELMYTFVPNCIKIKLGLHTKVNFVVFWFLNF